MKRTEGGAKYQSDDLLWSDDGRCICVFQTGKESISLSEMKANANHIAVTWNASKGMTTKQAGLYLEHGEEMVQVLKAYEELVDELIDGGMGNYPATSKLIALMEGK